VVFIDIGPTNTERSLCGVYYLVYSSFTLQLRIFVFIVVFAQFKKYAIY